MNHPLGPENIRRTLEAIYNSAVDSIVTISETGVIESVNPATCLMFGYSVDELTGIKVNQLMPEPYCTEHDEYLANYRKSGLARIIGVGREVTARKKDGTVFPVHLAVCEVQLDDRRIFAGFLRDLTDLELIREQQSALGRIIEESLNEVYLFEPTTLKFVQANRGARENPGYSLEEIRALTPLDLKPEFDEAEFRRLLVPLLTGEQPKIEFETIHRRKDGSIYDVEVHLQMSSYSGRPVVVAIILDVTKRRQAEKRVREQQETMQNKLEQLVQTRTRELHETQSELIRNEKFSTLGKVAGGIAHEIRNPLNVLKTSAWFLLNARELPLDKIREHLERIDRQVRLIDNVVTALSDVAKLPNADLQPVDLAGLLRHAVHATGLPAGIEVRFLFPENLPLALADENQIVIAVRNLIRNARDAMPDGGALTVGGRDCDGTVEMFVSDTGMGIPENELANLLEPLFTTKSRGMGLGLPITRAIVEKNKGVLSYVSQAGKGSTFTIALHSCS